MHRVPFLQPMDQPRHLSSWRTRPLLNCYQKPTEAESGRTWCRLREEPCTGRMTQRQARDHVSMGQVDTQWQQQYSSNALWFQFTPRQLAALYNERHPLSETLHLEQNGMAFSPSVQERTPSTAITGDGQAWVDFSARSLQPDGKHDGGDALELAARRNGESKAAKSNTLREAARMLVREARDCPGRCCQSRRRASNLGCPDHDGGRLAALPLPVCRIHSCPNHQQGGNWFSTCRIDNACRARADCLNDCVPTRHNGSCFIQE